MGRDRRSSSCAPHVAGNGKRNGEFTGGGSMPTCPSCGRNELPPPVYRDGRVVQRRTCDPCVQRVKDGFSRRAERTAVRLGIRRDQVCGVCRDAVVDPLLARGRVCRACYTKRTLVRYLGARVGGPTVASFACACCGVDDPAVEAGPTECLNCRAMRESHGRCPHRT